MLTARDLPSEPAFGGALAADSDVAGRYFATVEAALEALGPKSERTAEGRQEAHDIQRRSRDAKERFFRQHVGDGV